MTGRARVTIAAGRVLRALASARQNQQLYPPGHPNRQQAVRSLLAEIRSLHSASGGTPALFCTRDSLYVDGHLLVRESLSLFRLVAALQAAGIEAIEFGPDTSEEDLAALLDMIDGFRPLAAVTGGVHLNRVAPVVPVVPVAEVDLSELRRVYARGLDMVREAGRRVAAGRPVDLSAAVAVVDELSEEVAGDAASAMLLTTMKSHDEYTYYHMLNVCLLSVAVGQAVGLRRDQVVSLGVGALLHDIGKAIIPDDVLNHVGGLSEEQWRLVQRHPVDGAGLVFRTSDRLLHPAVTVILEHHAAFDLSGYPKLSGRPSPSLPARLVAVVDCFDAVTSRRSYRAPASRREALDIIQAGSGSGFDPRLARILVALLGLYPVGSLVELDTGEVAIVTRNNDRLLVRPQVVVVLDPTGSPTSPEPRDLSTTDRDGGFRWNVARTLDPERMGIDVVRFLTTGELAADRVTGDGGLVHEPAFGEPPPPGYVDTHSHGPDDHHHGPDRPLPLDRDIHPPFEV